MKGTAAARHAEEENYLLRISKLIIKYYCHTTLQSSRFIFFRL